MNFLVTAGPTREPIDPVRFVSNRSTGRMGYAVAEAAHAAGHAVRLVSGPVELPPPSPGIELIRITTADEMLRAVKENLPWCDWLVMAAAVADWRPARCSPLKLKKSDGPPHIEWEATPDILKTIAKLKRADQHFCGFAAETDHLARNAKAKLRAKHLDAIAANDVSRSDRGFASTQNAITLYLSNGKNCAIPLSSKIECAKLLVRELQNFAN